MSPPQGRRVNSGATLIIIAAALMIINISTATAQAPSPAPVAFSGGGGSGPAGAPEGLPSFGPSAAASPGPSAANDCFTPLLNMSDCLTYVEEGSNLTSPDKNCCPELAGLLDGNPICLCQLLGGNVTQQYGLSIDFSKALKLPSVCKLSTPPVSLCSAVGYPVAAPASTESSIPPEGFAASPTTGTSQDKGGASSLPRPANYAFFVGSALCAFLLTTASF
ncbi:hypothetical protein Tsubulata_012971 [Turnera subulata]|uniref:Bifunctional inhibitor/plant lipid transfer protein/seed storage helical domain-containing protein n=1 Tax=Turnera subulata TaxID=218843 RepID=A0A9Q0FNQ4_9ROSI|nr:hypothetical protein Tsubulata_012971 [Turnera subulata]